VTKERILSLTELTEWMADRGVKRSRKTFEKMAQQQQWGRVGNQYAIPESQAQSILESFKAKDS